MNVTHLNNPARQKLEAGQVVSCMSVKLVRSPEVARVAAAAGFDAIYVDMEHGTFDAALASQICLTAFDLGLTGLVRIPPGAHSLISQLTDSGAMGVIAPHIDSAEEAREIVAYAKFPPMGIRGSVNRLPQLNYVDIPADLLHPAANREIMVIIMIESIAALSAVENIAAVPGVDMLFVGVNDLSADMGIAGQYDHHEIQTALDRIAHAAEAHGKFFGLGGLSTRQDLLAKYVKKGARFISLGADLTMLLNSAKRCRASLSQLQS